MLPHLLLAIMVVNAGCWEGGGTVLIVRASVLGRGKEGGGIKVMTGTRSGDKEEAVWGIRRRK